MLQQAVRLGLGSRHSVSNSPSSAGPGLRSAHVRRKRRQPQECRAALTELLTETLSARDFALIFVGATTGAIAAAAVQLTGNGARVSERVRACCVR